VKGSLKGGGEFHGARGGLGQWGGYLWDGGADVEGVGEGDVGALGEEGRAGRGGGSKRSRQQINYQSY
jgi:hypothetical protein